MGDDYLGESTSEWTPTEEEIREYAKEQGWPSFGDIRYDHLETASQRHSLEDAVKAVRQFINTVWEGKPHALILLAGPADDSMSCTGYGCGKTMLAKLIYYSTHAVYWTEESREIWMRPTGKFYDAREVMALFDQDKFDRTYTFRSFGKLVVIDDVGREGTLRWEKRDPELQDQEKKDRYYSIIDHCYQQGISLVITSNKTSRELANFLGGASWSRLLHMCPAPYRINLTGLPDMRPLLGENEESEF